MARTAPSYKKIVNSWAMYDWANSAYITVVVAAVYPPFYRSALISAGFSENGATAMWAYTSSLALALICLAGPVLGAISDHLGNKKRFLAASMAGGVLFTGSLVFTDSLPYLVVSALFIFSNIGYSASILFYESLLPHITKSGDVDRVSTRGYMLGYLGGGLLLLADLVRLMHPDWFGLPDVTAAVKASLISVAL